ncbi:MAG: hypothetical protein RL701_2735, partial [Pseudomonadota bacterium]
MSSASLERQRELVKGDVLLAFDFDGTLAPIVAEPADASMRDKTHTQLQQLAERYPVVIISGRSRSDVLGRVQGIQLAAVIGNHGSEADGGAEVLESTQHRQLLERWLPVLEACVKAHSGLVLEDKALSVAIHYRHATDPMRARNAILEIAAQLDSARVVSGQQVVNIVPIAAANKGEALMRIRSRLGLTSAIYVGDDETDED